MSGSKGNLKVLGNPLLEDSPESEEQGHQEIFLDPPTPAANPNRTLPGLLLLAGLWTLWQEGSFPHDYRGVTVHSPFFRIYLSTNTGGEV